MNQLKIYLIGMKKNEEWTSLMDESKEIRKQILSMIVSAHASHIGSAYSIVELLVYLYERVLKINPKNPLDPNRDRFILSKGWGVSALYSVLQKKGFFEKEMLDQYCKDGSKMIGITTRNGVPGVEATTGSAGHGLPIGLGIAKALKLQKRKSRVFIIIGDGELNEGSNWEAMLIGAQHRLDNVIVIVDCNKWQGFGKTSEVLELEPLVEKWKSFNWYVEEVDGHNFGQIDKAIQSCLKIKNKPKVIIAHTIKGKGFSVIEDKNEYHYQTPKENELKIARKEGLI